MSIQIYLIINSFGGRQAQDGSCTNFVESSAIQWKKSAKASRYPASKALEERTANLQTAVVPASIQFKLKFGQQDRFGLEAL
jgi:hypothetical protein